MPKGIACLIVKRMKDFLWDGPDGESHYCLFSWEVVIRCKELEGLAIGNIYMKIKAILERSCW